MMRRSKREADVAPARWRAHLLLALLALGAGVLVARAVYLQVIHKGFLEKQGDARFTRVAKLSANRGMILDRNGDALAVSTPVDTIWANPAELAQSPQEFVRLAKALDRDPQWLARRVTSSLDREFVYLVRHMRPNDAERVRDLASRACTCCGNTGATTPAARSLVTCSGSPASTTSARKVSSSHTTSGWAVSPVQSA